MPTASASRISEKGSSFRGYLVATAPPATICAGDAGRYRYLMVCAVRRGTGRPSVAQDVVPAVPSCLRTPVPDRGERFTTPAGGSGQAESSRAVARSRKRRAGGAARRDDEDELSAYVKKVVDALPPLTEAQRDLLALIFRNRRK